MYMYVHVGGCHSYGPFLDPCCNTAPTIQGTQTRTIVLTTVHAYFNDRGMSEGLCNYGRFPKLPQHKHAHNGCARNSMMPAGWWCRWLIGQGMNAIKGLGFRIGSYTLNPTD